MDLVRILGVGVALLASFAAGVWLAVWQPGPLLPWESAPAVVASASPSPSESSEEPFTPRTPYTGDVLAFGDYVLVSVKPCLKKLGYKVDAVSDRRITKAANDLRALDDVPGGVLLHLGANGGASPADLEAIMEIIGRDRAVVWTTIQIPDDPERYTFEKATNAAIAGLAESYPNVRVFSWNSLSLTNPDWLNADGSMTKAGCKAFADFADRVMRG
jgi:hypothetical protein